MFCLVAFSYVNYCYIFHSASFFSCSWLHIIFCFFILVVFHSYLRKSGLSGWGGLESQRHHPGRRWRRFPSRFNQVYGTTSGISFQMNKIIQYQYSHPPKIDTFPVRNHGLALDLFTFVSQMDCIQYHVGYIYIYTVYINEYTCN